MSSAPCCNHIDSSSCSASGFECMKALSCSASGFECMKALSRADSSHSCTRLGYPCLPHRRTPEGISELLPIVLQMLVALLDHVQCSHTSFFSRIAYFVQSTSNRPNPDLPRPKLCHFCLSFVAMLRRKRSKLFPIGNFNVSSG